VIPFQTPWEAQPPDIEPALALDRPPARPRGRPPAAARRRTGPAPWLYHHLIVTGPAETVQDFREAARGSGIIPWATDSHDVEAFVFDLAASQPPALRTLSMEGCRMLARQFRERFEAHHLRAAEAVERSRACPLDLNALLPVPAAILRLGATDPAAVAWLTTHWGVADRLRQAAERADLGPGRRLPRGHGTAGYGFFTGGDTPGAVIAPLRAQWPGLRFVLRPRPD
jgi:hypothetical protein